MSALLSELANLANAYDDRATANAFYNALHAQHDAEDKAAAAQDLADEQRAHEIKAVAPALAAMKAIRQIDRTEFVAAALCRSIACDVLARSGHSHTNEFASAVCVLLELADDLEGA